MVHALVPSDRVEVAAVYGRDGQKIGTIERLMLEKNAGTVAGSEVWWISQPSIEKIQRRTISVCHVIAKSNKAARTHMLKIKLIRKLQIPYQWEIGKVLHS